MGSIKLHWDTEDKNMSNIVDIKSYIEAVAEDCLRLVQRDTGMSVTFLQESPYYGATLGVPKDVVWHKMDYFRMNTSIHPSLMIATELHIRLFKSDRPDTTYLADITVFLRQPNEKHRHVMNAHTYIKLGGNNID